MQYHDAKLLTTAANESGWPDSKLPEIVFRVEVMLVKVHSSMHW